MPRGRASSPSGSTRSPETRSRSRRLAVGPRTRAIPERRRPRGRPRPLAGGDPAAPLGDRGGAAERGARPRPLGGRYRGRRRPRLRPLERRRLRPASGRDLRRLGRIGADLHAQRRGDRHRPRPPSDRLARLGLLDRHRRDAAEGGGRGRDGGEHALAGRPTRRSSARGAGGRGDLRGDRHCAGRDRPATRHDPDLARDGSPGRDRRGDRERDPTPEGRHPVDGG